MITKLFSVLALVPAAAVAQSACSNGPAPAGPVTPGPGVPTTPHAAITGFSTADQLSSWRYWWELNKDRYLRLPRGKDAQSRGPEERVVLEELLRGAEQSQRDLSASALVAMAKVEDSSIDVHIGQLRALDRQVRDSAVLGLGISARPDAAEMLIELLRDSRAGRKLVDRPRVDDRMRYFAAYGLGLVANANPDIELRNRIFEVLTGCLTRPEDCDRDVRIAAVNSIRLMRPKGEIRGKHKRLNWQCVDALWSYFGENLGKTEHSVQSQVPTAIAVLLGRGRGPQRDRFKREFVELLGKTKRRGSTEQSAVIALGLLAQARELDGDDAYCSDALWQYFKKGKDHAARNSALMALARIGGDHNRGELLKTLARCRKIEKAWAGLAVGVLAFTTDDAKVDATAGEALFDELKDARNPDTRAALSVALGLTRYRGNRRDEAARAIAKFLNKAVVDDVLGGYACVGLGLMGYRDAASDIEKLLVRASIRPELFRQAATALALLEDPDVVAKARNAVEKGGLNIAKQRMLAQTLGYLRSRTGGELLLRMLRDREASPQTRAFAATALGEIYDKEPLPWSAKIAVHMNYAAAITALTEKSVALLPLL